MASVCQTQADAMGWMNVEMELMRTAVVRSLEPITLIFFFNGCPMRFVSGSCRFDQFRCHDGTCINATAVCDYTNNCPDFSDEFGCGKLTILVPSKSYKYINEEGGIMDLYIQFRFACIAIICSGHCSADQFLCRNYYCTAAINVCDYYNDCGDNSDEFGCGELCEICPPPMGKVKLSCAVNYAKSCVGFHTIKYAHATVCIPHAKVQVTHVCFFLFLIYYLLLFFNMHESCKNRLECT
jgi:hypothetical protein